MVGLLRSSRGCISLRRISDFKGLQGKIEVETRWKKKSMCFHKILWITISTVWYTGRSIDSSIDRSIDGSHGDPWLPQWAEAKLSASQPKCWKATGRPGSWRWSPHDDIILLVTYGGFLKCWYPQIIQNQRIFVLKPQYPYISQYMSEVPHVSPVDVDDGGSTFTYVWAASRSLLPVTLKAQILSDEPTATKFIPLHHISSPYGGWLWLINVRICHWRMDTILIH